MKYLTRLTSLLLLLTLLMVSGAINAQSASGLQNLGSGLYQDASVFNLLKHQGKGGFSYDDALESSVVAKGGANTFPKNADDLLPDLPRDAKGRIYPNSHTRIRPEQHAIKPGKTYAPRHHGQHYHVETRLDPAKSWNNKKNVTKIKPSNYQPGHGTGFLPGEKFPGAK